VYVNGEEATAKRIIVETTSERRHLLTDQLYNKDYDLEDVEDVDVKYVVI